MRIGIMQPYFFPYLGYFSLIKHTDRWIVFDPVQYDRKGWMNRNRILKPRGSADSVQLISFPVVKAPLETDIKDIQVDWSQDWAGKLFRQMEHYRKSAPYYDQVIKLLTDCFSAKADNLTEFNALCLYKTCEYLGFEMRYEIFSQMPLEIDPPTHPGQWALNICKSIQGISEYINPPGGRSIFKREEWLANGINLTFLSNQLLPYNQRRGLFEPGLSIIDAMMFNSPEEIMTLLDAIILERD